MFRVLREQWIRAKYERKEFSEPGNSLVYEEGEFTDTYTNARIGSKIPLISVLFLKHL